MVAGCSDEGVSAVHGVQVLGAMTCGRFLSVVRSWRKEEEEETVLG